MARPWLLALVIGGLVSVSPASGKPDIATTPAQAPRVEVSILETGTTRNVEAVACEAGSWFRMREGTIGAVLVRHPEGTFLFDAGYGSRAREHHAAFPWWARPLIEFSQTSDTAGMLRRGGVRPEDVRWIIPSHLHWDHVSAVGDFPGAEVWATQTEHDFAYGPTPPRVVRQQLEGARWRIFRFEERPYESFPQSLDLFGDGTLVLVPLPGHTPGAVGLFANLASGKRLFFTGDTTWLLEGFRHRADKSWLVGGVDADRHRTHRSIEQVADLMERRPEIVVVPAHDARAQADLAHFPAFEQ